MEPGPTVPDRDARLLGLALLHGYIESDQLQRAAEENSSPSQILAALRRSGAIDDPCMEGLEQALKAFQSSNSTGVGTGPTHMEPPRHLSATADGGPGKADSWDDDPDRLDSAARLLRQFTVAQWKQYRNLRFIGEGGMGRIYKALDPDLRRTVALKFLRGQEPNRLKRFLFEAQAQALVEHLNICRVYEVSEWQGQHYIAMQYVNGPTLLRAAPTLDIEEKLRIGQAVAEAVHAAHRRGLIHRDLKPANVLLEPGEDGRHKPYVLDFGLAREMEAPGLTASGLVLGTTAYISPEQARGEAHHVDRRTDVYGLGATLYELFAGCPPFGEVMGMACIQKVLEEEPRPLRSLAPHLPKDLETVVMKCLEKDPARRYDDAQSLAEDLRRVREGEPIQARPVTLTFRLRRYAKKNRAVVAVGAVALVGFIALGGIAAYTRFTAAVREQHIQHFSQEAERIEALLRYGRLLPTQNVEPVFSAARTRLNRLEEESAAGGRLARGPGDYAVGRALLAFGELDQALLLLQRAEREGFKSPELSHALGRCYGHIYQRELERAARLENPDLRDARRIEVERQWRTLALDHLQKAAGSSLEPSEFLEALLDSYGSRFDEAMEKVRRAGQASPWLYEALRLEGELQLGKARSETEPEVAKAMLVAASGSFASARRIAPSDATLWIGEARVCREYILRFARSGSAEEYLARCREAAAQSQRILPSDPAAACQLAWALLGAAEALSKGGKDAGPALLEGIHVADQVLAARAGEFEATAARIQLLEGLGRWQRATGQDPAFSFSRAVESARSSLVDNPGDAVLLSAGTTAAQQWTTQLAITGQPYQEVFRTALEWAERLRNRFPELGFSHFRIAALYIETADISLWHGGDPKPDLSKVAAALEAARNAPQKPLSHKSYLKNLGNLQLIRGQHGFLRGESPEEALEQAIDRFAAAMKIDPSAGDFGAFAEACLYRAMAALAVGSDPMPWIGRADAALNQGLRLDKYYWLKQLKGQSAWIQGRWKQLQGKPYEASFAIALEWLRKAASEGRTAVAFAWKARVLYDQARSKRGHRPDCAEGVRAALEALRLDRTNAEAALLLGQLRQLEAGTGSGSAAERASHEAQTWLDQAIRLNANLQRRRESPDCL